MYKQYWNETCFVCITKALLYKCIFRPHISMYRLVSQRNCVYHLLQCFTQDFYYFESDLVTAFLSFYSRFFCTETVTLSCERSTFAILSIISCCPRVSYKISNLLFLFLENFVLQVATFTKIPCNLKLYICLHL